MVEKKNLLELYRQNLEENIIMYLAEIANLDIRKAFDTYYSSKLAKQIEEGMNGIDNMDFKYLAEDIIENERELFECVI